MKIFDDELAYIEAESKKIVCCEKCRTSLPHGDTIKGVCFKCHEQEMSAQRLFEASERLPRRFQSASFETLNFNNRLLTVKQTLDNCFKNRQSVFHFGQVGCGKTTLHAIYYRAFAKAGVEVGWVSLPDFLAELKETYSGGASSETILNRHITVAIRGVLFIDDFGAEYIKAKKTGDTQSGWVEEQLYRLIDRVYRDCGTLWITSNSDYPYHRRRIGDRIVSRLMEMCVSVPNQSVNHRLNAVYKPIEAP